MFMIKSVELQEMTKKTMDSRGCFVNLDDHHNMSIEYKEMKKGMNDSVRNTIYWMIHEGL